MIIASSTILLRYCCLGRWIPCIPSVRKCASAAALQSKSRPAPTVTEFRTGETNTALHSSLHEAKFYTIPAEDKRRVFSGGGLPKQCELLMKTFTESCLMVRQPALELISYLKNTDFRKPVVRYVLYGENGVGKSLTLAHLLHYGYQNNFILVHVPWVANWMKKPKEISNAIDHPEGFIDLPFDAAAWLLHFKTQNSELLQKLELKTSKEYVWSAREVTASDSSLLDLLEHGIARVKFSTATIKALLNELKVHAIGNRCKVMVAIDGFNAFFHPITRIFVENKQRVPSERITIREPFLDICNHDWNNGVCLLTVDKIAMTEGYMESYMPRYLLGKKGFEYLDPFVPISITNYTDKEYYNCMRYYMDRNWIQTNADNFEEQLKYLSNKNPYTLMRLTRSI